MSREKPPSPAPAPAPAVVSTGCSSLKSYLSGRRRGSQQQQQQPPPPRRSVDDAAAAVEVAERCWRRVQLLEEVKRLSGRGGEGEATDRVGHGATATAEGCYGSVSTATATTTAAKTTRCAAVQEAVVVRLENGSYMRVGPTWDQLAVQVSRPAVPADAASASEVLDKMAAMRAEDLCKFLMQLMPLKDITGEKNLGEPVWRRTARSSTGDDLVEALVVNAMDKLGSVILEGLKIQMASPSPAPTTAEAAAAVTSDGRRGNKVVGDVADCMVHVVLMQARDPKERYSTFGDPMIGLIETSLENNNNNNHGNDTVAARLRVRGLHVAGISLVKGSKPTDDGRCLMWSAYLRRWESCGGDGDGDGNGGGVAVAAGARAFDIQTVSSNDRDLSFFFEKSTEDFFEKKCKLEVREAEAACSVTRTVQILNL